MRLNKLCVVALDDVEGLKDKLIEVSEGQFRFVSLNTVFIAVMGTAFTAPELKDVIDDGNRNLFIFEINHKTSIATLKSPELTQELFGSAFTPNIEDVEWELVDLDIDESNIIDYTVLDNMSKVELNVELNKLIDKGVGNLNTAEKSYLDAVAAKLSGNK